jgi:radical SAM protein with 4Fe4S-binding SPASM domain
MKYCIFLNQDSIYEFFGGELFVHNLKEETVVPLSGEDKDILENFVPLCTENIPGKLEYFIKRNILSSAPEVVEDNCNSSRFSHFGTLTISPNISWRNSFRNSVYLSDWYDSGKNFLIGSFYARTWELIGENKTAGEISAALDKEYGTSLDYRKIAAFIDEMLLLGFLLSDTIQHDRVKKDDGYVPLWALDLERVRKYIHCTPVPWVVVYELTYRCNLACNTCYAADMMHNNALNKYDELSTSLAKKFIDQLAGFNVSQITLQGGEPFMRTDWQELVRYMRKKRLFVKLVTNGVLVTEKVAEQIVDAGVKQVDVSLDGLDPETNDKNRYPGAFYGALKGINNLINAGISRLALSVTLTRKNFEIIERLPQFVSGLGIKELHIMRFLPKGAGKNNSDWVLTGEQYKKLGIYLKEKWPEEYPHMFIDTMRWRCDCGKVRLTIDPSGNARACTFHGKIVGNVLEEPFSSIWQNSPDFNVLRQPYKYKEVCKECDDKYYCKNTACSSRIYEQYQTLLSETCVRDYNATSHLGEYDPDIDYIYNAVSK